MSASSTNVVDLYRPHCDQLQRRLGKITPLNSEENTGSMRAFISGLLLGLVLGVVLAVAVPTIDPEQTESVLSIASADQTRPAGSNVRWNMSSVFPGNLPVLGDLAKRTSKQIATISRGEIQLAFHEPDALVPALETFEAVSSGVIDAAFSSPLYSAHKVPALQLFAAVPFGPDAPEYAAWMEFGGGNELFEEFYRRNNIHAVLCGATAPIAAGWFKREIKSVEDLQGLRMAIGGLGAKVMARLGVATWLMSADEIQRALKSGQIDAASYSVPSADRSLKFQEVARFYYFPGWYQQAGLLELLVNLERWQSLNAAQRRTIESVCGDNFRQGLAASEAFQFDALKDLVIEHVVVKRWPPELLDALKSTWHDVVAEESAADPDFKRVWDSMTAFHRDYEIWRELGYL
jgi:TRAP-type mannitol/chloroaromatic compound transport system substrate-binding protein